MRKSYNWLIIVNLILCVLMILCIALILKNIEWYAKLLAYSCIGGFTIGSTASLILRKASLAKSLFIFNVMTFLVIICFGILNLLGIFERFSDLEKIKQLILSAGGFGYLLYALILLLNVVILPLPAFLFIIAGVAIYGPLIAFIINYISFVVGSIICFLVGKVFGQRVICWCIGKENTKKYKSLLGNKGKVLFIIMQILPFFPDDILCMVAGLTSMSFKFFLITILISKIIYILPVCLLGTGSIIPFSGWGIPVWIAIFALLTMAFILFCKYQTQIENKLKVAFNKKGK